MSRYNDELHVIELEGLITLPPRPYNVWSS